MTDLQSIKEATSLFNELDTREFGNKLHVVSVSLAIYERDNDDSVFERMIESSKFMADVYRDKEFINTQQPHIAMFALLKEETMGLEKDVLKCPEGIGKIKQHLRRIYKMEQSIRYIKESYNAILEEYSR